jgi:ABC-type branched-subunit amino acid transport system substrate-binding protein
MIYPTTGTTAAALQAARSGFDARLGVANAAGGVNGRKITYQWRDDQGAAGANLTASRNLVNVAKVFGIVEESPTASGGAAFLAGQGIPVVGLAAESATWLKYPNMVSAMPAAGTNDVWAQILKQQGVTKLAVLRESLSAVDAVTTDQIITSARAIGIDTVLLDVDPQEDPATTAHRVQASGADGLTGVIGNLINFDQIALMARTGTKPVRVTLALAGYDRNLLRATHGAMANQYIALSFRPFEAGGLAMNRFLSAMTEYAPQVADPRQEFALRAYVDADLYIRGLQLAGPCPTRAGFLRALHSLSAYDADGLVQPFDLRMGARQATCLSLVRVDPTGSSFEVVNTRICGPQPRA